MYNVGIIGLGVGEQHIAGYQSHPACHLKAVCDFSEEKQRYFSQKYPTLRFFKNANDILRDPEISIVSIATYDNYHCEQIITALSQNKHVFVEKPICLTYEELEIIHSHLEKKPELKLTSNLILRKCPRFVELKKRIENFQLGDLYYIEGDYNYGRIHKIIDGWRGQADFYSVMTGGGIHMIDLIQWLTQDRVIEVMAYGNNVCTKGTQFRFNDMAVALLHFQSGMIGKVSANFGCVFPHFHRLSVYGTQATFLNGQNEAYLYKSRDKEQMPERITTAYPGIHKGDLIHNFIDSIMHDKEPEIPHKEIIDAMCVCLAVEKAIQEKNPVKVNYLN